MYQKYAIVPKTVPGAFWELYWHLVIVPGAPPLRGAI